MNKPKPEPPTEQEYREARYREAINFCPRIYPCNRCHWPVVSGYCCNSCGNTTPSAGDE